MLDRKGASATTAASSPRAPGLYVIGLKFLRRRKSSFIDGAAADAADVVAHLANHLAAAS